MAWFKRQSAGIKTEARERNEAPEGYWQKCPECSTITSQRDLDENARVCPDCQHHYPIAGLDYLKLLFDAGQFTRHDSHLRSTDPLSFEDRKPYTQRVAAAERSSGLNDAAVSGTGLVGGHGASIAAMDFRYIGGSMGSVVGEILTRTIRRATEQEHACVIISQSGGARMMEGALSLMQMAKTSANLAVLAEKGLPYISVLTNPTTGGVTASFAMLGDVQIAEPGALIGFAGPRVIRETIGRDLPRGFQRAEFLVDKGFVDMIRPRSQMRSTLTSLFGLFMEGDAPPDAEPLAEAVSANGKA